MATNTKNFNFKKPDESDFYSIQDQNGNWDLADEELQKLNEPAFEDYTTGTSVPPAATALEALKSKIKLPVWMSNVVAFCKGCCTLAMIVNNCVSSDADKPLAAAQGKALQDQLTKLYSDLTISDAKMAVERNSKGVYLMLRNKITNNRLSLLLDEGTKKLVLDSEISGEWTGADPIITKSDLDLQTQKLHKNVVIYRIGNIAMLSISSWVRKEELAGVTIPTGYRPVKNISIPFTQQNFNDGSYCDVTMEGKINYTGTSPILVNAVWFCA